ncbi:endonuclease/exonuclease/phosphatase family protein [Candidatus Nomurabacteria bacterium]|nr:endonuclease/exonuclease/phosphatase family protein [Candidatus Nomurabacteria bacterium]
MSGEDPLKLLSVNIEGKRHLDKINNLIDRIKPDVLCMMEVFEDDAKDFAKKVGGQYQFGNMFYKEVKREDHLKTEYRNFGIAIISNLEKNNERKEYYFRDIENIKIYRQGIFTDLAMVVLSADFKKGDSSFRIATTHFCKSENGVADNFQKEHIGGLMNSLENLSELVVCGDFNAPRGMEIFEIISSKYKDNIDPKYETSLDANLHRAGYLPYMVDGLFSTPEYEIKNMYFETGVSDHYAIVADVIKR